MTFFTMKVKLSETNIPISFVQKVMIPGMFTNLLLSLSELEDPFSIQHSTSFHQRITLLVIVILSTKRS